MYSLKQIRKLLENENLSEVARHVGVTPQYISAIVRGDNFNPTYKIVLSISEWLDKQNG